MVSRILQKYVIKWLSSLTNISTVWPPTRRHVFHRTSGTEKEFCDSTVFVEAVLFDIASRDETSHVFLSTLSVYFYLHRSYSLLCCLADLIPQGISNFCAFRSSFSLIKQYHHYFNYFSIKVNIIIYFFFKSSLDIFFQRPFRKKNLFLFINI